jgi:Nuclease-related domain
MVPNTISSDRPASERRVYQVLSALPDDWTVFYSTGWQSERHGRQGDGEADFVLLHRRGLLVLEVKGGTVRVVDGTWQSVSALGQTHRIRDPFQQALDSRMALQRYLREHLPGRSWLHTGPGGPGGHGIYQVPWASIHQLELSSMLRSKNLANFRPSAVAVSSRSLTKTIGEPSF